MLEGDICNGDLVGDPCSSDNMRNFFRPSGVEMRASWGSRGGHCWAGFVGIFDPVAGDSGKRCQSEGSLVQVGESNLRGICVLCCLNDSSPGTSAVSDLNEPEATHR